MKYEVLCFEDDDGRCPVEEFLKSLPCKNRSKALREIEMLEEFGWDLGAPHVKMIKGTKYKGLYELRVRFASDLSRILYFSSAKNTFVLLHGFLKKTNKTPTSELDCAYRRMLSIEP